MLKCSQSHWTWWILGVLLAHQFKVKSKQLVHTFNKLNHLSKGLSQAHQPHRLNWLLYNLNWLQSMPQSSSSSTSLLASQETCEVECLILIFKIYNCTYLFGLPGIWHYFFILIKYQTLPFILSYSNHV